MLVSLHVAGEVFDVTCFTGINQYHCLRVQGECGPAHLSSQHIRAVDFEMACTPSDEVKGAARKEVFAANTRAHVRESITYLASIHLAWEEDKNHESTTPHSFGCIQASRADLQRLEQEQLDPEAQIVTAILDVVTDMRHFHFVKHGEIDPSVAKQVCALPLLVWPLHTPAINTCCAVLLIDTCCTADSHSYRIAIAQLSDSYRTAIR